MAASLTRSKNGLSVAKNILKSTGAISKFGKYIPHVGPAVSSVASSLGYGIPGYGEEGGALNYGMSSKYKRRTVCTWACIRN